MNLQKYVYIWIFLTLILAFESYALNLNPEVSLIKLIIGLINPNIEINLSPEPGRPISLYLGWIGISTMLLTNIYVLKKKYEVFRKIGNSNLAKSLNFHIFCGLLGPTLILFHCNFKVRGLVAISFWSMMVSFTSGIVGRYFYAQILKKKSEADQDFFQLENKFKDIETKYSTKISVEQFSQIKQKAFEFVGIPNQVQNVSPLVAFWGTLVGDFRLILNFPQTAKGLPPASRLLLTDYALAKRRSLFIEPFQKLMGYWHTFHLPFAVFMYVAAVIHIVSALLFGVVKN